ncbi:hypothetical protein [Roseibium sp.]|uniref:hypothetical protein n=1 Tax=Roseibium sp. TaxID=1936156 RepID=UPI0032631FE1
MILLTFGILLLKNNFGRHGLQPVSSLRMRGHPAGKTPFPGSLEKIVFASCIVVTVGLNTRHQRGGAAKIAPARAGIW